MLDVCEVAAGAVLLAGKHFRGGCELRRRCCPRRLCASHISSNLRQCAKPDSSAFCKACPLLNLLSGVAKASSFKAGAPMKSATHLPIDRAAEVYGHRYSRPSWARAARHVPCVCGLALASAANVSVQRSGVAQGRRHAFLDGYVYVLPFAGELLVIPADERGGCRVRARLELRLAERVLERLAICPNRKCTSGRRARNARCPLPCSHGRVRSARSWRSIP